MKYLPIFMVLLFSQHLFGQHNFDDRLLLRISSGNERDYRFWHAESKIAPPLTFAVPIGLAGTGWLRNDRSMRNKGLVALACVGLTSAETMLLKNTVRRPRPYTRLDIPKHGYEKTWSFPSGHTSTAFATATALTLAYPKWQVAVPAYLFAGATGYSRMRLGVHYPSDVLVGALIGVGTGFLCHRIGKRYY